MVDHARDRLEKGLNRQDLALLRLVAREAEELGLPIYAVGGLPRDLELGRSSRDLDLVVEGDAVGLARSLAARHGGAVTLHRRFGTATWKCDPTAGGTRGFDAVAWTGSLDLITARKETYPHPAQLPLVRPGTIDDDLRRRDFTINAIAIRLDGEHFGHVLDPLGGIVDVRARRIRALHDRSFVDDPMRMLRAVRYEQRLGFRIGRETSVLMRTGRRWIDAASGQRLRHELDLVLAETRAAAMLRRLSGLGVLRKAHPLLPADSRCLRRLAWPPQHGIARSIQDSPPGMVVRWMLWLMDLGPAGLRSVSRRLAFTRKELESMMAAAGLYQSATKWVHQKPSELTLKLDALPEAAIEAVRLALPAGRPRQALEDYLGSWRHVRAHVTGSDLRAMGLKPGPRYRSILQSLRAARIDGTVQDAKGEHLLLDRLIGTAASRPERVLTRPSNRRSA